MKQTNSSHGDVLSLILDFLNANMDEATGIEMGIDNLYPAVIECFAVIFLG
jgi:hypothetical protein